MQTYRRPFQVNSTGQLPVLRLFSARSTCWFADLVELALHHAVGPGQVDQVGLLASPQPQHERRDRLAQARVGRGVVIRNEQPLPFKRHAGSDRVRIGSHQLGLHPPVAPQPEGQPVLTVAEIPGKRRAFTWLTPGCRAADRPPDRRPASPDGDRGQARPTRAARAANRLPSFRAHCGKTGSPGFAGEAGHSQQIGTAVEVQVDRLRACSIASR